MLLALDWMNLFNGLSPHQIFSVIVVAIVFTADAGLILLGLLAFGVRAGLMAPTYTSRVPAASSTELWAFLAASAFGFIAMAFMVLWPGLGLAENDLDNALFFPLAVGPVLVGGVFLITGAALAFRTVRRRRATVSP